MLTLSSIIYLSLIKFVSNSSALEVEDSVVDTVTLAYSRQRLSCWREIGKCIIGCKSFCLSYLSVLNLCLDKLVEVLLWQRKVCIPSWGVRELVCSFIATSFTKTGLRSQFIRVIYSFLIGILKTKEHIWHFRVTESFEESPNIIEANLQQKTSRVIWDCSSISRNDYADRKITRKHSSERGVTGEF